MSERRVTVGRDEALMIGNRTVLVESRPGDPRFQLRPATRIERARLWLRDRWERHTRWFRPRTVSALDSEPGTILLITERWSWRRWRWERR